MVLHSWYAVQVKPKFEHRVACQLEHKGYDYFLPLYRSRRQWSDRVKQLELPLFPSYVFCRVTAGVTSAIVTTPGVIRIVGAGKQPIAVDEAEMNHLQRVTAGAALRTQPWPFMAVGERVRITEGPLEGLEGTLCREANSHRFIVSITLLQRSVAVEVEPWTLEPIRH